MVKSSRKVLKSNIMVNSITPNNMDMETCLRSVGGEREKYVLKPKQRGQSRCVETFPCWVSIVVYDCTIDYYFYTDNNSNHVTLYGPQNNSFFPCTVSLAFTL
jgi:hypothetical protein